MMEKKFKAFHSKRGMSEPFELGESSVLWEGYGLFDMRWLNQDCVFIQSTGLKDKGGTEIYEGDIVKSTTRGYKYQVVEYGHGNCGCCDGIYGYGLTPRVRGGGLRETLEVVGNIHETPELLEE